VLDIAPCSASCGPAVTPALNLGSCFELIGADLTASGVPSNGPFCSPTAPSLSLDFKTTPGVCPGLGEVLLDLFTGILLVLEPGCHPTAARPGVTRWLDCGTSASPRPTG
jgi:hypothetical protein